jgi:hypothetical protein
LPQFLQLTFASPSELVTLESPQWKKKTSTKIPRQTSPDPLDNVHTSGKEERKNALSILLQISES